MCQGLRAIQQSITAYAAQFDARTLTGAHAGEVIGWCARIEATAASIKALAAARAADAHSWQPAGYRSASEQLAAQAGMSPTAAKRALETGRRLAAHPDVAAAALAGNLSWEQTSAVADGVAADPATAGELIDKATRSSLPELNDEVANIKAARRDPEQQRRDRHTQRSLRRWTDRDGALHAHLYGHPEDGARLWRTLDPIRRRLNLMHRQSGTTVESLDTLDYDAMMTMAAVATGTDTELDLADLVELGLFPQFDTSLRRPAAPPPPPPAHPQPFPTADPEQFPGAAAADAEPFPTVAAHAELFPGAAAAHTEPFPTAAADPEPFLEAAGPEPFPVVEPAHADPTGTGPPPPSPRGRRAKKLAGSPIRIMIRVDLDTLLRDVPLHGELCEIAGYGPIPVSVVHDLLATENPFIIGILTNAHQLIGVYHHGRHPNAHQRSALDFVYPTCAAQGCSSRHGLQYDHRHDYAKTHYTAFDLLDRLCAHHHRQKTQHGWALIDGHGKRPFVPPQDPRHPRHAHPDLPPPQQPPTPRPPPTSQDGITPVTTPT